MGKVFIILMLLVGCTSLPPETISKKGKARIKFKKLHTPYYIDYMTGEGRTDFNIEWEGPVNQMIIIVDFLIRPTTPPIQFPIHQDGLFGNQYTLYKESIDVRGYQNYEGELSLYQRGDYVLTVYLINPYWSRHRTTRFKVH